MIVVIDSSQNRGVDMTATRRPSDAKVHFGRTEQSQHRDRQRDRIHLIEVGGRHLRHRDAKPTLLRYLDTTVALR